MKVLFCGDREWTDRQMIAKRLVALKDKFPGLLLCHGAARGADTIAGEEAIRLKIPVTVFPAQWSRYGRGAGPIRNQQMLDEFKPNLVEAFHDNIESSKGTKDMISRARRSRIVAVVNSHASATLASEAT